ncbi:DUF4372 domain-containing protein [Calditrichota bacterium]
MAKSITVIAQIQKLVLKKLFENLSDQYHVNKRATEFFAATHFAVLLFAQIRDLKSNRDVHHATAVLIDGCTKNEEYLLMQSNRCCTLKWN